MCGDTELDRIRNERIRESAKVGEIAMKVQERRRAYDEKGRPLPRKKDDGNGFTSEAEETKS